MFSLLPLLALSIPLPLFFPIGGYNAEPEGAELFLGGQRLTVHSNNRLDPYITVPDEEDVDEEEEGDLRISTEDVVLCVGRTEDEDSNVEVYVYDQSQQNLYVHHDFPLPSFPLSMCWIDCDPRPSVTDPSSTPATATGSFLAVGTFQSGIEIWNLDVLDVLEPVCVLGGREEPDREEVERLKREERKKNKGKLSANRMSKALKQAMLGKLKEGSHADAVMSLAWHPSARERLASGSADSTVKLWDLRTQQCKQTWSLHTDKVQSLHFNYSEANLLLSAAYDKTAVVADDRIDHSSSSSSSNGVLRFSLPCDPEQARWSPHVPFLFAVSGEDGAVRFFDARAGASSSSSSGGKKEKGSKPLFTIAAHDGPCTSISFSPSPLMRSCIATAGADKVCKIWELDPTPALVTSKDMKAVGRLYAASFDVNYSHLLAAGGDKGKLAMWDLREDEQMRRRYGEQVDGQVGKKGATKAEEKAKPENPFAEAVSKASANGNGASAAAAAESMTDASSSSSSAATAADKKKKKKKKTKLRRVKEEGSDED